MTIEDKALVGVETDAANSETNVTIRLRDQSRFSIGTETSLGGGLQVGNRFGKANLLFDPSRDNDIVNFNLEVDGPGATFQIGKQGFLGFGIGITGNQVEVPNFFAVSTVANVNNVTVDLKQGRFEHDQIASSLDEKAALLALGAAQGYTFNVSADAVLAGGANLATIIEANKIHPTVQDKAGAINPGGIRNRIVIIEDPDNTFDEFYGPPKGFIASETFSLNQMMVGILSSSLMLTDSNKQQIGPNASQQELFNYLDVAEYKEQGRKRAPITDLDDQLLVGFLTERVEDECDTINRPVVDPVVPCRPLSVPFDKDKVLEAGAVGVKVANINGVQRVIRVYDLDPEV